MDFTSKGGLSCQAPAPKFESRSKPYGEHTQLVNIYRKENSDLATSLDVNGWPGMVFL
jgi:hypothetical protein